jgi:hypothetical protein
VKNTLPAAEMPRALLFWGWLALPAGASPQAPVAVSAARPSQIYGRVAGQVAARPGAWLTPRGVDILSQLG